MSILEMSFYGGVMILAVVLLRALTVHRLPKRTFVVLWLLTLTRLLLPFTIPSPASVYTLAGEHNHVLPIQLPTPRPAVTAPAFGQGTVPVTGNPALPAAPAPVGQAPSVTVPTVTAPAPAPTPMVPVWTLVWLGGLAFCALFFLFVYVKNQREFRMSLPVENAFLTAWLEGHPLRRRVRVRQLDWITAPLTYGLVRPVILLPADTNWANGEELAYVLEHEFIHIKRWDGLTKLLLAAAVCVHWFNPLVWLMFFLANRDLELSCDEGVLRRFGTGKRGEYARTLIGMEETRAGLTPIYNHFSKSSLEERVVAIMKTQKKSLTAVIAAVVLVAAVAVMFATSPREDGSFEGEAFFQDNSLTHRGDTLVPLEQAVEGLDLSWRQEGESLFLNDGAVEIELRAGDYYVYRRGYVTDVLQKPMALLEGKLWLPISFCNQYLSEGGNLCHTVKYFFKDEIRDAVNDPTAEGSRRVLAAVSLPRSMGIETVNLNPNKIFEERELDDYPEALAAELSGMGVPDPIKRTYSEYVVLTEARTVTRAGLANEFLEDLPGENPDDWTVGEYYAWQQSELLESRLADLAEEERKFVEEKDIQPEDLPVIQREFYFDFLSHTDEELKTVIEAYYQFALAKVMGE